MKKTALLLAAGLLALGAGESACAQNTPIEGEDTAAMYDAAVDLKDSIDQLDVTVEEVVSVAGQPANAETTINIQTSRMSSENGMKAAIDVQTDEGEKQQYYENGYFYSNQTGDNMKFSMSQDIMKDLLNRYVYLDLNSEYLSSLKAEQNQDGSVTYAFEASADTIQGYEDKLLEGAQEGHNIDIVSIKGTLNTDADGNMTQRDIEMVYTVNNDGEPQMCVLTSSASFNTTTNVKVELPNLDKFDEKKQNKPAIHITKEEKTLYATDDLNIRAQNNVTSAVLGGIAAGQPIAQTGYTDDGWIQIQFNDTVAYVSASYTSETKPVIIHDMSGTMYATSPVNVRESHSTDSAILGTLSTDDAVTTTGYTDNGWIRISYQGKTAYVNQSYLTWTVPVAEDESDDYTGYLEGTVISTDVGNIHVETTNGMEYTFYTSTAKEITDDGIVIDDWVGVTYKYKNGRYIASKVEDYPYDYASRSKMQEKGYQDMASYGTVIAYDLNQIIVALDNGTTLSADLNHVNIQGDLYNGAYVIVNYIGSYMYMVSEFEP